MAPRIFPRQENFQASNNYIAGSVIAGIFVFVVLLCLLFFVRYQRRRADKKRTATPFRVQGVIRPMTTQTNFPSTSTPLFNRSRLTASIVMPKKSITRKPHSPTQAGLLDKTGFSPKSTPSPTSSTLSIPSLRNTSPSSSQARPLSTLNPAHPRHRRTSSGFSGYTQLRFPRVLSSRLSNVSFAPPSQARPVHQPFEPTLADELAPRCGEYLTVLRSFDDGWCVVARDASSRASLLSAAGMKGHGDNIDIGLVPQWVFSKPLEGVISTRPFRSTSLNALNLGQNPVYGRDWVTSWSNFA